MGSMESVSASPSLLSVTVYVPAFAIASISFFELKLW
jgi:hypothetical protein